MNAVEFESYSKDVFELQDWIDEILPRARLTSSNPDAALVTNETILHSFLTDYDNKRSMIQLSNRFNSHEAMRLIYQSVVELKNNHNIEHNLQNIVDSIQLLENTSKDWDKTKIIIGRSTNRSTDTTRPVDRKTCTIQ